MGNWLNELTGAGSSARQQLNNQMTLQKDAQAFAKWQMGNAHQMEIQDLENAGLNPVLSAGGSGASAGVTEGSASAGSSSGIDMLGLMLNTAKTISDINKQDAETDNINADTKNKEQTFELTPELTKSIIDMNNASSALSKQKTETEFYNTIRTETESYMKELEYRAQGMDYEKRRMFYEEEIELYATKMEIDLIRAGLSNNKAYQAADLVAETAGKVLKVSANKSTSTSSSNVTSKSTSKSTVGVKNLDYNPVRHQAIGF